MQQPTVKPKVSNWRGCLLPLGTVALYQASTLALYQSASLILYKNTPVHDSNKKKSDTAKGNSDYGDKTYATLPP